LSETGSGAVFLKFNVDVVDHFCEHRRGGEETCDPVVLSDRLRGKKAVVIRGIYDQSHLRIYREAALRAGLNPLLVQVVDYRWSPSTLDAAVAALQAAWVADRASVTEESVEYTRRELMTGKISAYRSRSDRPVYIGEACGDLYRVCDVCERSCPHDALRIDREGRRGVQIDGEKCVNCGLCAAACPMGAIQMPNYPDSSFVNAGKVKGDKVVSCFKHGGESLKIPCVGELGAIDLLSLRADGAVTVHCPDPGCPLSQDLSAVRSTVEALGKLYGGFAFSQGAAVQVSQKPSGEPQISAQLSYRRSQILRSLLDAGNAAILGAREALVDGDACTLCENCAKWCPTAALKIERERESGRTRLTFDPRACVGCGVCVSVCPEFSYEGGARRSAISLAEPRSLEPRVLAEDSNVYCRVCGALVGTRKSLDRVRRTLEARGLRVDEEWLERCPRHRFEYSVRSAAGGGSDQSPFRPRRGSQ